MESRFSALMLYVAVFISGMSVLVIEILGTRILAPIFGTTIYVWSGLITVTLFSLALGYVLGGKIADKKHSQPWFYGIFLAAGIALLIVLEYRAAVLLLSDKAGVLYGPLVASFLLFSIPLLILGMIDPFAVRLQTHRLNKVGSNTGLILGIATAGGLTGALLSAYVLLPLLSIVTIFQLTALLLIVTAVIGFISFKSSVSKKSDKTRLKLKIKSNQLFLVLFALVVLTFGGKLLSSNSIESSDRFQSAVVLYERQNLYSLNRVLAIPSLDGVRCFAADSALQTCIDPNKIDQVGYTAKMGFFIEQLPQNSRMMLLGLGGGKILKEWGRSDITTDVVDINPDTFDASEKYFGVDFDESYNLFPQDARQFLRKSKDVYQLILVDVATTFSPPAHLYTKEFFNLLSQRLDDNGVVVMLLQEETPYDDLSFQSLIKTASTAFGEMYGAQDGVPYLLTLSNNYGLSNLEMINHKIRDNQTKYNAGTNFSEFKPLPGQLDSENPVVFTDNHNPVEFIWRDKISLFQKFSVLLREDF